MFIDRNAIYLRETAVECLGVSAVSLTVFSRIENHWLRLRARAEVIDGLDLDIIRSIDSRRHHPQGVICDCFFFPFHWGSLWLPGHSVFQSWSILLHGFQRLKQKAGLIQCDHKYVDLEMVVSHPKWREKCCYRWIISWEILNPFVVWKDLWTFLSFCKFILKVSPSASHIVRNSQFRCLEYALGAKSNFSYMKELTKKFHTGLSFCLPFSSIFHFFTPKEVTGIKRTWPRIPHLWMGFSHGFSVRILSSTWLYPSFSIFLPRRERLSKFLLLKNMHAYTSEDVAPRNNNIIYNIMQYNNIILQLLGQSVSVSSR